MSASGASLGPTGQCKITFRLGNKQFTDRFIVLQDIILGLNWQCNYRKGCNLNVNGQQYITYNKKFLCTSTASLNMAPIVWNSGVFVLLPRSISIISVQASTKLYPKHLYQLDAAENLPSCSIPSSVDHKIDHKKSKLLKTPLLNREHKHFTFQEKRPS